MHPDRHVACTVLVEGYPPLRQSLDHPAAKHSPAGCRLGRPVPLVDFLEQLLEPAKLGDQVGLPAFLEGRRGPARVSQSALKIRLLAKSTRHGLATLDPLYPLTRSRSVGCRHLSPSLSGGRGALG